MKFINTASLLALAATIATSGQAAPAPLKLTDIINYFQTHQVGFFTNLPSIETVFVTLGQGDAMPAPTDKPADLGDTNADQAAPNDSELANASSDESAISEAGGENSDNAEPSSSSSSGSGASDWVTQMICRVNAVRAQHGVEPLGLSSELDTLAQGQSDYQNSINQMTHSNPAGGIGDRLTKIGITWASAAENVAAGMQTAEDAQQVLENSPGHLANMVDPSMAYFGAARTNNYFTQEFYGASGNTRAQNIPQCN